jgi:lysyl-tRNA synthetase class 2
MGSAVGPRLGAGGLCFVHHYPASQAALARLDPADPRVALRFELYCRGVELANGFEELAIATSSARASSSTGGSASAPDCRACHG